MNTAPNADCSETNFFHFATKEISHSSFWAWLIVQSGQSGNTAATISGLLNAIFAPGDEWFKKSANWKITREYGLGKAGRIDVLAECKLENKIFAIENKIQSQSYLEQPERYKQAIGTRWPDADIKLAYVDTGFDFDGVHSKIRSAFILADLKHLYTVWHEWGGNKSHLPFLVKEYFGWVSLLYEKQKQIEETLCTHDANTLLDVLRQREAQYPFLEWIMRQLQKEESGLWESASLKNVMNYGKSCIQLWFHEREQPYWMALFFRMELRKKGSIHCSLRFYTYLRDAGHQKHFTHKIDLLGKMQHVIGEAGIPGVSITHSPRNTMNEHIVCNIDIAQMSDGQNPVRMELKECFSRLIDIVHQVESI